MAPKVRNVEGGAGFKRSRKGDTAGSSSSRTLFQKFGKQAVEQYGKEWFKCQKEAKYLGDEFVNEESLDDDEVTADEEMDEEDNDDVGDDDANALMVFNGADDVADARGAKAIPTTTLVRCTALRDTPQLEPQKALPGSLSGAAPQPVSDVPNEN
ncbi:hypothetical protein H5410_031372 [Solanum commersonii]|uniref:Uncharacterized protein n=1 Tax=Solanum commersonii TaxID=4109 RepID=A0A9J5YI57_SOLCO|nr:hypothetical protein H5410_031372 [Solanum commersonii]